MDLTFHRLAVTPQQITDYDLPTRPTKITDSRSRTFEGDSVEVDAIPAPELRRLVAEAIERHIDPGDLERITLIEQAERDALATMARGLGGVSG